MVKKLLSLIAVGLLAASTATHAVPITFSADLDGASENPPNNSLGTGTAVVTYDPDAHTLTVNANFSGLTGVTTVAHIHCCVDAPGNVGVATYPGTFPGFPVGVNSGTYGPYVVDLTDTASYTGAFLTNFGGGTAAGAEAALFTGLSDGRAYFNIHTDFRPGGEIRGFLQQVPEPGTLALLGLGLAGLAASRRRRK